MNNLCHNCTITNNLDTCTETNAAIDQLEKILESDKSGRLPG